MGENTFIFMAIKGVSVFASSMLMSLALVSTAEADPDWKSREKTTITLTNFYSEYIAKAKRPRDQLSVLKANLTPDFFAGFQDLVEGMDADSIVRSEHWGADYRHKIRVYNVSLVGELRPSSADSIILSFISRISGPRVDFQGQCGTCFPIHCECLTF
jgi:hypothetical protein